MSASLMRTLFPEYILVTDGETKSYISVYICGENLENKVIVF